MTDDDVPPIKLAEEYTARDHLVDAIRFALMHVVRPFARRKWFEATDDAQFAAHQIADQIDQSNIKYEMGPPLKPGNWPVEWSAGYRRKSEEK